MKLFKLLLLTGITAVALICFMILTSCSGGTPDPVENADGTVTWNDWTLTRAELHYPYHLYGDSQMLKAQPHVIKTGQSVLSLTFEASNSDNYTYGVSRQLQVRLSGEWYTLPFIAELPVKPIDIPTDSDSKNGWDAVKYEVDFSSLGVLPVGTYRLAEIFNAESDEYILQAFARFWVVKPGAKAPAESATTGKARLEDIELSVDSSYPAQRAVMAGDNMFTLVLENLSGKTYKPIFKDENDRGIILERLIDGNWTQAPYSTANTHTWFMGWDRERMGVIFRENLPEGTGLSPASLSEGRYRVRFPMKTDAGGVIEPSCEFDVLMPEDAPPPEWVMDELRVSEYEGREPSSGVVMTPKQSDFNSKDINLEVTLSVKSEYTYDPSFEMEILIDEIWYRVPFADARIFTQPLFIINNNNSGKIEHYDISSYFGVIPKGKYRVIEVFKYIQTGIDEYSSAEFTVVNE